MDQPDIRKVSGAGISRLSGGTFCATRKSSAFGSDVQQPIGLERRPRRRPARPQRRAETQSRLDSLTQHFGEGSAIGSAS
eukprot:1548940-Prymnesium_polylepis.1